jgi:hypothetical protein
MKSKVKIKWLKKPEDHDYPSAESYLNLIYDDKVSSELINKLKKAKAIDFKSKDIFRASELSLMGIGNIHVERDIKKLKKGLALSPLLLVRDSVNGKVIIADGYHRLCAVYSFDEDAIIPCRIV